MQDRVPLYPGRVTLTPVAGQANTYDMVRADQPIQEGTPLSKATLLKDYTANLLGLPNTAVPDDALLALLIGVGTYGYRVKIQLSDGTPVEGATVSGITALTGSTLVSGADGIVLGKSTSQTVTIGCTSPYIDQAAPSSQSVTATGTITDVTLTLTAITDMITVTSSKTAKVSPMAKAMDVTAVGGGGGGGGNYHRGGNQDYAGGGGGGGYATTEVDIPAAETIKIAVGSGGAKGSTSTNISNEISTAAAKGGNGGETTITVGKTTVRASGGTGGSQGTSIATCILGGAGNGTGGKGAIGVSSTTTVATDGTAATSYIFNDPSFGRAGGGGGGGGGGDSTYSPHGNGGAPNGGKGNSMNSVGTVGSAPGGGGGGGGSNGKCNGFAGGAGGVYLRFHF